jgi:trehalose-6-phosphatase
VQLEELGRLKNPLTSLEIEPTTSQPVAQCLNQLRYRVSHYPGSYMYNVQSKTVLNLKEMEKQKRKLWI